MNERVKVSYKQIEDANAEIETTEIKGKQYAEVHQRVKAFRKVYPAGAITTIITDQNENGVIMETTVRDENGEIIATGRAGETKGANKMINAHNLLENCETSAVGRALGFAGFGISNSIASNEDIKRKGNYKNFEIANNMYVAEETAKQTIQITLKELARKMAITGSALDSAVKEKLWVGLKDCTAYQLLRLEDIVKSVNNESNEWHNLYKTNTKIKNFVDINTEVVYESSNYKFGQMALEQAGTDELLRNEIIDQYINMGIELTK